MLALIDSAFLFLLLACGETNTEEVDGKKHIYHLFELADVRFNEEWNDRKKVENGM